MELFCINVHNFWAAACLYSFYNTYTALCEAFCPHILHCKLACWGNTCDLIGRDARTFISEAATVVLGCHLPEGCLECNEGMYKVFIHKMTHYLFLTVSQVLLCDTAVVLLDSSVPLSSIFLDFISVFLSPVALVLMSIVGCSSVPLRTAHQLMLTPPIWWYVYWNKEDFFFVITLSVHSLFPAVIARPPRWRQVSRESRLMVFRVGGFSSCCCSLTGRCVTDSRRSLVPSSSNSAWLSRLAWISWRSITAIFDNSRYSKDTCRQGSGDEWTENIDDLCRFPWLC